MRFLERMAKVVPPAGCDSADDAAFRRDVALAWYILHAQYDCTDEYAKALIDQYLSRNVLSRKDGIEWFFHDGPVIAAAEAYGLLHLALRGTDFTNWRHSNNSIHRFTPEVQDYYIRHQQARDDEDDD